jgi:hypothetical protein
MIKVYDIYIQIKEKIYNNNENSQIFKKINNNDNNIPKTNKKIY